MSLELISIAALLTESVMFLGKVTIKQENQIGR